MRGEKVDRITGILKERVNNGTYESRLPGSTTLATEFGVNFKTVERAISRLVKEGVLVREPRRGTFLHPDYSSGVAVREIAFVFPGSRALSLRENPSAAALGATLAAFGEICHRESFQLRLLPISPMNDYNVNMTVLNGLGGGDYVVFLSPQYLQVLDELASRGARCLVIGGVHEYLDISHKGNVACFDVDHDQAFHNLVQHLKGSRRRGLGLLLSVVTTPPFSGASIDVVWRLQDACKTAGIGFSIVPAVPAGSTEIQIAGFRAHLATHAETGAFLAWDESTAVWAFRELTAIGRRVPEECAVISWRDFGLAKHHVPPISAMTFPIEEMLEAAFVMIREGSFKPGTVRVQAELIIRETG